MVRHNKKDYQQEKKVNGHEQTSNVRFYFTGVPSDSKWRKGHLTSVKTKAIINDFAAFNVL